jgi:hypothetical protein
LGTLHGAGSLPGWTFVQLDFDINVYKCKCCKLRTSIKKRARGQIIFMHPCSVPKCVIGKFDPSNRYVHFFQIMFTGNIIRLLILLFTCICRRCESALNFIFEI